MSATIFTVKLSEIEGRLDPEFYNPKYFEIFRSEKSNWARLNSIVKTLKHPPEYKRVFAENGYQLIRSQNVRPTGIDLSEKPVYLAKGTVENCCRIFPKVGDILVVRSGVNAGDVAVVEEDFINTTIGADTLLLNVTSEVLPKFVQIYFYTDVGRNQLNRYITGATNKHINSFSLRHVYFPIIELHTQKQCISIFENSLLQKQQKQQQAKELLASIDTYLLSELGITLPQKDNSLSKRIFTTKFSEVSGGRLDPLFNSEYFKEVGKSFQSKYELYQLKLLANAIFQGCGQDLTEEKSKKLLKVKNIQTGNIIDYDDIENIREIPKSKILMSGDIISPFIGEAIRQIKFSVFYTHIKNYEWTVDNNTGVIRINEKIADSYFIAEVLNSSIGELQIEKLISGGGVPFIGANNAKKLLIPLPSLPKQKEIAGHIRNIRTQAKQLQSEAVQIMQDAKHQVEKMILGEQI